MRNNKPRPIKFLLLSIISLITLSLIIYFFPPDWELEIGNWKLEILYSFLLLLFIFFFSTTTYISKSAKHGLLLGLFVISYLGLRLINLTHIFFFLLLAGLFLMLELLMYYEK